MKIEINRNVILWIIIGLLALLIIYNLFFQGLFSQSSLSAGQAAAQQATSGYGGMVGGC